MEQKVFICNTLAKHAPWKKSCHKFGKKKYTIVTPPCKKKSVRGKILNNRLLAGKHKL